MYPAPQHCLDAVAGKLADPVPAVPESDAQLLPPERWAQQAWAVPCTPDAVRCAGQSCAATVLAGAAQSEPMVLLPWKLEAATARRLGASSNSAQQPVLPASLQRVPAPSATGEAAEA